LHAYLKPLLLTIHRHLRETDLHTSVHKWSGKHFLVLADLTVFQHGCRQLLLDLGSWSNHMAATQQTGCKAGAKHGMDPCK